MQLASKVFPAPGDPQIKKPLLGGNFDNALNEESLRKRLKSYVYNCCLKSLMPPRLLKL
jgi:hypothetical protein